MARNLKTNEEEKMAARFQHTVEMSPEAVFWLERNGLFSYANEKACRSLGYTSEELLTMFLWDIDPDISLKRWNDHWEDLNRVGTKTFETRHRRKDGWIFPVEVSACQIVYEGKEFHAAFVRDIMDRKKAEEERTKLNSQLEVKVKELEEVVYVASHDLRSPLVTIEGFSGILGESLQKISATLEKEDLSEQSQAWLAPFFRDSHEAIGYISQSASSMASLLRGLLQASRLSRIEVTKETLDLNKMISEVLVASKFQREQQGVKVTVSTLPDCEGDRSTVGQIFGNLIGNALKYSHPERPCIIKISGQREGGHSVYCVEDNGVGIAPEYQKEIFKLFHQLNRADDGEGLGLSIVQKIVEWHGGKIWVESEVGKGSRFYVSL